MIAKRKLLVVTGLLALSPTWLAAQTEVSNTKHVPRRFAVVCHAGSYSAWVAILQHRNGEGNRDVGRHGCHPTAEISGDERKNNHCPIALSSPPLHFLVTPRIRIVSR